MGIAISWECGNKNNEEWRVNIKKMLCLLQPAHTKHTILLDKTYKQVGNRYILFYRYMVNPCLQHCNVHLTSHITPPHQTVAFSLSVLSSEFWVLSLLCDFYISRHFTFYISQFAVGSEFLFSHFSHFPPLRILVRICTMIPLLKNFISYKHHWSICA